MYGFPHAGKITNKRLTKHLAPFEYAPVKHMPVLWAHRSRPISFTLVVDNFGIKYINPADAEHLQNALRKKYDITTDMTGAQYCGLTLAWNYTKKMSMYLCQGTSKKYSTDSIILSLIARSTPLTNENN